MEEGVLNPVMLDRLQNRVCQGLDAVKNEPGTKAKITLNIEIAENYASGKIEELYTLDMKIGDSTRHEAGGGAQLTLPEFVSAAMAGPPNEDWQQTN
jgi:hypothetical protein